VLSIEHGAFPFGDCLYELTDADAVRVYIWDATTDKFALLQPSIPAVGAVDMLLLSTSAGPVTPQPQTLNPKPRTRNPKP